jgi:hypothetical protein
LFLRRKNAAALRLDAHVPVRTKTHAADLKTQTSVEQHG